MKRRLNHNNNKQTNIFYNFILIYKDLFSLILINLNINELVPLCRLLLYDLNNVSINNFLENHLLTYYDNIFVNFNNVIFRDSVEMYLEQLKLTQKDMVESFKKRLKIFDYHKNNIYLSNLCEFGVCDFCKTIPLDFENAFVFEIEYCKLYENNRFYVCKKCNDNNDPLWLDSHDLKEQFGITHSLFLKAIINIKENKEIRTRISKGIKYYYNKDFLKHIIQVFENPKHMKIE